jgi:hypothetical protein
MTFLYMYIMLFNFWILKDCRAVILLRFDKQALHMQMWAALAAESVIVDWSELWMLHYLLFFVTFLLYKTVGFL